MWSNDVLGMLRKFGFQEFGVFVPCRPRYLRIEWVNALIEGFVIDGDVDILGKTLDGAIDLRKRSAPLKSHRKTTRHGEEALEHPADPYVLF